MFAIVAAADNWAIGKDNDLLINLPPDKKRFRALTTGRSVIMGRSTLLSLPNSKPLPKRKNYVLSRNLDFTVEGAVMLRSADEAIDIINEYNSSDPDGVVCMGGESVYRMLLPYTDYVYVTRIYRNFPDADRFFPNLDELGWICEAEGDEEEYEGIRYRYYIYRRP